MNLGFYILVLNCFTILVQDNVNSFNCVCYLKFFRQLEVLNYATIIIFRQMHSFSNFP